MLIKNLKHSIKVLISSNKCKFCKLKIYDRFYICKECYEKIKYKKSLRNINQIYYSFDYENMIRDLILDYKKKEYKDLSIVIAKLIREDLEKIIKSLEIDIVIPVPLSKKRLEERGFNQIELILDLLNIKYKKIFRIKNTKYMFELDKLEDRKRNIEDAFRCYLDIENKNILIVDDIITTGSTIFEIIKTLKSKGKAKNIFVYSIAKVRTFKC